MAMASEASDLETAFLKGQAGEARERLSDSLGALPQNLGQALCLAAWTKRFPWAATGVTALGAFAVAVMIERRLNRPACPPAMDRVRPRVSRRRRAGRLVRGALRRWVVRPLRAALYARLYGLF